MPSEPLLAPPPSGRASRQPYNYHRFGPSLALEEVRAMVRGQGIRPGAGSGGRPALVNC